MLNLRLRVESLTNKEGPSTMLTGSNLRTQEVGQQLYIIMYLFTYVYKYTHIYVYIG